jgi:hypothetical protein
LKCNDFKSDPRDQVQNSYPDVRIGEIRRDYDGQVYVIIIPITVFVGE